MDPHRFSTTLRLAVATLLSATLLGLLIGCKPKPKPGEGAADADAASTTTIGVITILSGENASYGKYTKAGIELAWKERRSEFPNVKLDIKDSKGDPEEARTVFKELVKADVPLFLGPFTSTEARIVGPEAQREKVVMLNTSSTADDLSSIGDHAFMMFPPNKQQGSDLAKYALRKGKKEAAILYRNNPYGKSLQPAFREAFEAGGGKIVAEEVFPDGAEDFTAQLKKLAEAKPPVVFCPVHDEDMGRILRQASELDFPETEFMGTDGCMTDNMIKQAKGAAEGTVYANIASKDPGFNERYEKEYGEKPSPFSASAYDALHIVLDLIKSGARSPSELQAGLVKLEGHDGASGTTKFTKLEQSYWSLSKEYTQYRVVGKKFELVERRPAASR